MHLEASVSEDPEGDHASSTATDREHPGSSGTPSSRWWLRPAAVGALLTVVCFPLHTTVPGAGIDPSWQLGLSLAHLHDIAAGPGFVFTYGPLGFLAEPDVVWLPGALLGLVYIVVATFALYFLVCRALQAWLSPVAAAALTALFALCAVQVALASTVAEFAIAALVVWALTLVRPPSLDVVLPLWVPVVFGGVAALQLLVKFGAGGAALAVGIIVTVTRPPRLRNVAVVTGSFLVSLLVLWLLAQQSLTNLPEWLARSLPVTFGYSSAQARFAGLGGPGRYWLFWLAPVVVLVAGLWQCLRGFRARALPVVTLVAFGAWFFTKEGFTRLDPGHARIAFLGLGVLVAALPWERRWRPLGLTGFVVALLAVVAVGGAPWREFATLPQQSRSLVTQPYHGLVEAGRIVRSTVQPSYRSSELRAAGRSIRAFYQVPDAMAAGLHGAQVHADPTAISAVWAYGLHWRPVPVFQTYSAYTNSLDQANADSLRSRNGPNAVIRELVDDSAGHLAAWESPNYMVTLTCSYRMTAATDRWQSLTRARDACGSPRQIGQRALRPGARIVVPTARNPRDVVVATFDYPTTLVERLATTALKPSHLPEVVTNGHRYTFVVGTASHLHLVHVPQTIGARSVTNGGLDIRTLSFPNAPSAVAVHFYELATS